MPEILRALTADRGDDGLRLDLVLRRHLTDVRRATRTRVQAWIEGGLVTVNGALVRRVSTRAARGDIVSIALPDEQPRAAMAAEDVRLEVLFEDDRLIAIDKPAGLVVHPTYKHAAKTLMNALLGYGRAWPAPQRPSLVSRLDKLTSGVVVVAKDAAAHAALQRAMAMNDTEKDYLAVVYGRVNVARGWPVVGDPTYGEPRWSQIDDPVLAAALRTFPRQALHAWRVAFTHPITRARLLIEAPVPRDIEELLETAGLRLPKRVGR